MRRWGLAAVVAVLVALGAGWPVPGSATQPGRGAGPASVDLALAVGLAHPALSPRSDPRDPAPLAPPAATGSVPGVAAALAPAVRSTALSPAAVPAAGGRSPPPAG
jgi:hypothetical protein